MFLERQDKQNNDDLENSKDRDNPLGDFSKSDLDSAKSSAHGDSESLEGKLGEEFFIVVYGETLEHWLSDPVHFVRRTRGWINEKGFGSAILDLKKKIIDSIGEEEFDYLERCDDGERIQYLVKNHLPLDVCKEWCVYSALKGVYILSAAISRKDPRLVEHSASFFDGHVDVARTLGLNSWDTIDNLSKAYSRVLNYACERIESAVPFSARNRINERETDIRNFIDRYGGGDYRAN